MAEEKADGADSRARNRAYDLENRQIRYLSGASGAVVEFLAPGVFEIEFTDNDGRTFASLALKEEQLLALHYEPAA